MQIKTTLRLHLTPVKLAAIKKTKTKAGKNVGSKGTLMYYCWECKLVQPLWKSVWRLLQKLKIDLSYDLTIPLLDMYPKESESVYKRDACTSIFSLKHSSQ
jgi:hypothetical protein